MRARNIKPSFFMNEDLAELDAGCRLLFIGLWCLADREGFLKFRPKRIWAELFPYNRTFETLVVPWLNKLNELGFLGFWTDNNHNVVLIEVNNFIKHQSPHQREKASELKPLTDGLSLGIAKDEPRRPERGILKEERGILNPEGYCSKVDETTSEQQDHEALKIEPLLSIPLNKKGTFFNLFPDDINEWEETFPGVDVLAELKRARQWSIDNPKRRKTKTGIRSHLSSWLDKAQNQRARTPPATNGNQYHKQTKHEINDSIQDIGRSINERTGFNPYEILEAGDGGRDVNQNRSALPEQRSHSINAENSS